LKLRMKRGQVRYADERKPFYILYTWLAGYITHEEVELSLHALSSVAFPYNYEYNICYKRLSGNESHLCYKFVFHVETETLYQMRHVALYAEKKYSDKCSLCGSYVSNCLQKSK